MKGLHQKFFSAYILRIKPEKKEIQEKEIKTDKNVSLFLKQAFIALGPMLLTICSGMTVGYSAILLPQLQSLENSTLSIDREEASWIASVAALPMAVGSAFGGIFSAKLGRKMTHSISCLPTFLGWLTIFLANRMHMILIGRFITGFTTGMLATVTGVYIGETSDPKYRGFLLGAISFSIALGLFLAHLIGTFLSWQNTALMCSLLPLLSQILMFFTPESPSWLAGKSRFEEAKRVFYWCRGTTDETKRELEVIIDRHAPVHKKKKSFSEILNQFLLPEFLKPLGIITIYIIANQWVGINVITFYSVNIMKDIVGGGINEYLATLVVDIMRLVMSTVACVLLKTVERRPLALISGIGTFITLLTLTLYTYFVRIYPQISSGYIPLLCLVLYIVFVTIGFVPLPWAMMAELYPLRHRSIGSGFSSIMAFLAFFSVVKSAPSMFEMYGSHGTFFIFSLVAFFGTTFVYFYLPETKGRPLHEIEDSFKNKK
ncbi:facilitated trehalose transporter Tret1-like isoform X1 [Diabrotica undecimpunctata]|uniref:facilitated trehalose transporter Tret1-like isoform X1 n=2 Tax=Diabrotica undecimpunctata TaxID=50387 RepID=UPI003B641CF4